MKKFRFQFDPVLRHRRIREEEALRALGAAQRAYQQELATQAMLRRELESALGRRESLGSQVTSIMSFRLEQDFIDGLKQRILRQEHVIARASKSVEKALRAYLLTRRETRAMELLYERHFADWKRARARKEQMELDDLVVMRSGRASVRDEATTDTEALG